MKKIFISQSNYIPWKGYFDAINMADIFVVYDDMQYTKNDWRNRNIIKTHNGLQWLTIPIEISSKHFHKINEMEVSKTQMLWKKKHWQSIMHNYSRSPFYDLYKQSFQDLFENCNTTKLSEINLYFLTSICDILNITTQFVLSSNLDLIGDRNERLINICKQLGVGEYISGPAAKVYIKEELFNKESIKINWLDYSNYPEYFQLHPPFNHSVSIIDLIFNCGPNSNQYLKSPIKN